MILEALGFKTKIHVGISVSPNNFIELVYIDEKSKSVVSYVSNSIKYNNAVREIMDFNEFSKVLVELFEQADLNPEECSVSLNLPNVHFGIYSTDNSLSSQEIEDEINDELKDLYIFKRNDPAIRRIDIPSSAGKNIVYGAIQAKTIVNILDAFDNIGAEVVRIDTSYSSLLKTLIYCDRFNKYIRKDNTATVILVTSNSCVALSLKGQVLSEFSEEPLAVKSFSIDEVYSVIAKIASNTISKVAPQTLLIISEADEVDAEQLARNLSFNGEIDYINKSANQNEEFIEIGNSDIDPNIADYLTLEAVGAAVSDYDDFTIDLNYLPQEKISNDVIKIGDMEGSLTKFVIACVAVALVCALVLFAAIHIFLSSRINEINTSKSKSEEQINVFKNNAASQDKNKESIFPILQAISDNNRAAIDIYNALSTEIPSEIYVKRFVVNPQGGIGILGESRTSDAVNNFIKGLKEKDDNLMVSKLSANDISIDPTITLPDGITFEIKTSNTDVQFVGDLLQNQYMNHENNAEDTPSQPPVI